MSFTNSAKTPLSPCSHVLLRVTYLTILSLWFIYALPEKCFEFNILPAFIIYLNEYNFVLCRNNQLSNQTEQFACTDILCKELAYVELLIINYKITLKYSCRKPAEILPAFPQYFAKYKNYFSKRNYCSFSVLKKF